MYSIIYDYFPNFIRSLSKYNKKNKDNSLFKIKRKEVINSLKTSPRNNNFNPHQLSGKMKGFWSIDTGLNSNSDRVIYIIDDNNKHVILYDIGNHSIYENILNITFEEFYETRK